MEPRWMTAARDWASKVALRDSLVGELMSLCHQIFDEGQKESLARCYSEIDDAKRRTRAAFAASAATGILQNIGMSQGAEYVAKNAWSIADAMLKDPA